MIYVCICVCVCMGPPEFCEEALGARLQKLKASLEALCEMGDAQLE